MCDCCRNILIWKKFDTPRDYLACIEYISQLVADGGFEFLADEEIIDQIVDWFGKDVDIKKKPDDSKVKVKVKVSPNAMEHWAMQYINHVEILAPESFRSRIRGVLETGLAKYSQNTEEK